MAKRNLLNSFLLSLSHLFVGYYFAGAVVSRVVLIMRMLNQAEFRLVCQVRENVIQEKHKLNSNKQKKEDKNDE